MKDNDHPTDRILTARGLGCAFAGPLDIDLGRGECLGLTGPSGSGKSAVLRMLADLIPHRGIVALNGTESSAMTGPQWRRRVRYVQSEPGWWAGFPAAHLRDPQAQHDRLRALHLDPGLLNRPIDQLSTGERQRIAFLRATEDRPEVLLLDEPSSALDPETTLCLEAMVRQMLAAGAGVVLVSHDAAQIARLADRIQQMPRFA